jgi:hypothetical protein
MVSWSAASAAHAVCLQHIPATPSMHACPLWNSGHVAGPGVRLIRVARSTSTPTYKPLPPNLWTDPLSLPAPPSSQPPTPTPQPLRYRALGVGVGVFRAIPN